MWLTFKTFIWFYNLPNSYCRDDASLPRAIGTTFSQSLLIYAPKCHYAIRELRFGYFLGELEFILC